MSVSNNAAVSQSATVAQTERRNKYTIDQWEDKMQDIQIPKDIINKLVMNYLIVEGYKQGALKFEKETGIKAEMDFELIDKRIEIRRMIEKGHLEEAITAINLINPEILDQNMELQFELKRQHLVELIKAKKIEDAIIYGQAQLSHSFIKLQKDSTPQSKESVLHDQKLAQYFKHELEKTMTLLMYEDLSSSHTVQPPIPPKLLELVDTQARKKLAGKVNMAILQSEGLANDIKIKFYWQMLQYTQQQLGSGDNAMEFPKLKDPIGDLDL